MYCATRYNNKYGMSYWLVPGGVEEWAHNPWLVGPAINSHQRDLRRINFNTVSRNIVQVLACRWFHSMPSVATAIIFCDQHVCQVVCGLIEECQHRFSLTQTMFCHSPFCPSLQALTLSLPSWFCFYFSVCLFACPHGLLLSLPTINSCCMA